MSVCDPVTSFEVKRCEFLCLVCKGISNVVLPILPYRSPSGARPWNGEPNITIWIEGIHILAHSSRKPDVPESEKLDVFGTLNPADLQTRLRAEKFQAFATSLVIPHRHQVISCILGPRLALCIGATVAFVAIKQLSSYCV